MQLGDVRQPSGELVLANVLRLEPASSVHWKEPPSDLAEERNGAADPLHLSLARGIGHRAELAEHVEEAVPMPHLIADDRP